MPSCHSTNDISAELISQEDIPNGTIVITDHQKKGRGQGSNIWESTKGENLTMSIILTTHFLPVQSQFYLNILVSLSISDLLMEYLHSGVLIKWPNDIYYKGKKISGILIQNILRGNILERSIIGMGINVNQQIFQNEIAISLKNITGKWYDLPQVLERLSEILEGYYIDLKDGSFSRLKLLYMKRLMWLNEDHLFQAQGKFTGRIVDIDNTGRLIIKTGEELRTFAFKEIKFIM